MKQIPPLILTEKHWIGIEREIQRILDALIYKPLTYALEQSPKAMLNAGGALLDAITQGRVWYINGQFHGDFNARISKDLEAIGAKYDRRAKTWALLPGALPTDLRFAQASADSRYDALRHNVLHALDDMQIESIDKYSETKKQYGEAIEWLDGDFRKTVQGITIAPNLTTKQKSLIAEQWGNNLDLYIKGWADEAILELRQKVQANTFQGGRAESLVKMIQHSRGVSKDKAKFLARQETSLLMSKFRETRYDSIGVRQYRWSTSHDQRVRHDHKELNGKVFSFDAPPVTNKATGARNNPGEDFGCRCVAIGLIN